MSENPIALYNNLLATANGQPEGGELVTDNDTTTRWFPADTDALEFTALVGSKATHVGFAAHNLGTTGNSVLVEYYDGASWLTLTTLSASDDQAKLIDVGTVVATGLRLTAQGSGINIGIVYIGEIFEFERSFYQGHTPIRFGDQNNRFVTSTNGGQYAGNQVRRRSKATSVSIRNLTPQFVRTKLEPFRQHYNNGGKFFFSWRPDTFPDEAVFARGDRVMSPTNTGPAAFMGVDFGLTAYVQTYRPDLLSPAEPPEPPAPWTPDQISPELWLDASDSSTVTLDGSGNYELINNKGSIGGSMGQTSVSARPGVGSLNGLDVMTFDGSNDRMNGSSELLGIARNVGAFSIFVVGSTPSGDSFRTVLNVSLGGGAGVRCGLFGQPSSSNAGGKRLDSDSTQFVTVSTSGDLIHAGLFDYTNAELFVGIDGVYTQKSGAFQTPGLTSDTDSTYVTIGADGTGSFRMNGEIAEVVAIRQILTLGDRQKLEGYFAWKWGLEGSLPSGHPYKNEAPTV